MTSVDLYAPGISIVSVDNTSDSAYATGARADVFRSGTSFAAPHVAGALALLKAKFPFDSYLHLQNRVLSSVTKWPAFAPYCSSGGVLNLSGAVTTTSGKPFNDDFADAAPLKIHSQRNSVLVSANNVDATHQSQEPDHGNQQTSRSVWWYFTPPQGNSTVYVKAEGVGFTPVIVIASGLSQTIPITSNIAVTGKRYVTYSQQGLSAHYIGIDAPNGASGSFKLTVSTVPLASPLDFKFVANTVNHTHNSFSAQIVGPASANAKIQISSDLLKWVDYATVTLNGSGQFNYTDSAATAPIRYYRALTGTENTPTLNAVGYLSRNLSPGYSVISFPFRLPDQTLNRVLATAPFGSILSKWVNGTWMSHVYDDLENAWLPAGGTLSAGEGAFFYNPAAQTISLRVSGEVPEGFSSNPVPQAFSLEASFVAKSGKLVRDLLYPVESGDEIYKIKTSNPVTYDIFTFVNGVWSPSEPAFTLGEGFWSKKTTGSRIWFRNVILNP